MKEMNPQEVPTIKTDEALEEKIKGRGRPKSSKSVGTKATDSAAEIEDEKQGEGLDNLSIDSNAYYYFYGDMEKGSEIKRRKESVKRKREDCERQLHYDPDMPMEI